MYLLQTTSLAIPKRRHLLCYAKVMALLLVSLFAFTHSTSAHPTTANPTMPLKAQNAYQAPSGTLTIYLFEDRNVNAVRETGERGVSGVKVNLYDATGDADNVCASKVSNSSGLVTFAPADTASCAGSQLRLEVERATYPPGMVVGPVNMVDDDEQSSTPAHLDGEGDAGPTTQIVDLTSSVALNISVINPTSYTCSPENAYAMATCFVNGDSQPVDSPSHNMDALVGFPYTASGAAFPGTAMTYVEPDHLATMGQIGSTWGLAWSQQTEQVYVGSFFKRHVALGPLGLDGIYRVDFSTGTPAVENWMKLTDSFGIDVGNSVIPSREERALPTGLISPSRDSAAWPLIATVGLGDVDLVTDEALDPAGFDGDGWIDREYLFVMNLYERAVHVIDPVAGSLVLTYDIPTPSPVCTNGTHRPWAVDYRDGEMYVGLVCDGSGNTDAVKDSLDVNSNLEAIIYKYDLVVDLGAETIPTTPSATPETILRFALDYQKGSVWSGAGCPSKSNWHSWRDTVSPGPAGSSSWARCWPTPILADIDFSDDGNMLIAMMDRSSHQWGFKNVSPDPTDTYELYQGMSGGDMLMACPDANGNFVLENDATCGNLVSTNTLTRNDGPGGKEFFWGDSWPRQSSGGHQETANNGIAVLPGTNEVIAAGMDPYGNRYHSAGGINWYSTKDGTPRNPGYMLYASRGSNSPVDINGTAGKSGGLGDVDLICPQMPTTIGDYVWLDEDGDGIQDPDEKPLVNVMVHLELPNGSIVTTATDSNGNYFFDASRNQSYTIAFDPTTTTTPLPNGVSSDVLRPTLSNSVRSNDRNDSDIDGTLVVAGKELPSLSMQTSRSGSSDQSIDAGFSVGTGNFKGKAWSDIDRDGIADSNEPALGSIIVEVLNDEKQIVDKVRTDADGTYEFTNVPVGRYQLEFSSPTDGWWITARDQGSDDNVDSDVDPNTGLSDEILLAVDVNEVVDVGFVQIQVGDKVWHDANGDGIQGSGESGLSNVTVELVSPGTWTDCAAENEVCRFSGTATVRFGKDGNFAYKSATDSIGCTERVFGDPFFGASKMCQYLDVSGDAVRVLASTSTDADGLYFFDSRNVPDGIQAHTSYELRIGLNDANLQGYNTTKMDVDSGPGASDALDSDAARIDGYAVIRIATGSTELVNHTFDFGFGSFSGAIGGEAWNDLDGTGIQNPIIPLAKGVPVSLYNSNGARAALTETDDNGQYAFTALPADTYQLEFDPPVASVWFTIQDQGDDEALDSDVNPMNGRTINYSIDAGTTIEHVDAGLVRGATAYSPRLPSPGDIANTLNEPVSLMLHALDDNSEQIIYEASNLPPGLSIGQFSGEVSGTPTSAGTYETLITAKDGKGGVTRVTFVWTINEAPKLTCSSMEQEAEHALLRGPFARVVDGGSNASGGHYIMVPNGTGNHWNGAVDTHAALFCIIVEEAGLYRINGSVMASIDDNSFYVKVDSSPWNGYVWHLPSSSVFEDATVSHHNAENQVQVRLSEGEHVFGVYLREDGSKIDKLSLELIEPMTISPTCGSMVQEAESGVLFGRFATIDHADASGGKAIHVADGLGSNMQGSSSSDRAEYCFTVPTSGDYLLEGVTGSPNGNADSFYVTVDNAPTYGYLWDTRWSGSGFETDRLNNRGNADPVILSLFAGQRNITVYLREDGTILDKLSLVEYEPVSAAAVTERSSGTEPQDGTETGLFGTLVVPTTHSTEPELENISVRVTDNNGFDESTVTDVYGKYYIDDVAAGTYNVQMTLPADDGASNNVEQSVTVGEDATVETSTDYMPPSVSSDANLFLPLFQGRSGLRNVQAAGNADAGDTCDQEASQQVIAGNSASMAPGINCVSR